MLSLSTIVEVYRLRHGLKDDGAVADKFGISKTTLSNYKSGNRRFPDRLIVELAEGTELKTSEVLAAVHLNWKNTDEEDRPFWLQRASDAKSIVFATSSAVRNL
jgi:transcriptional regulator with XRE-family HTH domain